MDIERIRQDIENVINTKKMTAIGTMITDQERGYQSASPQSQRIVQEIQTAIDDEERLDSLSDRTDETGQQELQALNDKYANGKQLRVKSK